MHLRESSIKRPELSRPATTETNSPGSRVRRELPAAGKEPRAPGCGDPVECMKEWPVGPMPADWPPYRPRMRLPPLSGGEGVVEPRIPFSHAPQGERNDALKDCGDPHDGSWIIGTQVQEMQQFGARPFWGITADQATRYRAPVRCSRCRDDALPSRYRGDRRRLRLRGWPQRGPGARRYRQSIVDREVSLFVCRTLPSHP